MLLQNFLLKIGFNYEFAPDIAFLFLFIIASIAFGLFIGRFKLVNVLINVYIAIAILGVVPDAALEFGKNAHLIIFVAIVAILNLMDSNLFDIHISGSGNSFFWRLFLMSFFEMGLILSVVIPMFSKKIILKYISLQSYDMFASEYAQFIWAIAPLAFLVFINKKQK